MRGILYKYGVDVLGTPVEAIRLTEDRELFADRLHEIGVKTPRSMAALNVEEAKTAAETIGYPVMIRAAFALGGAGSGLCKNAKQLVARCEKAFFPFRPRCLSRNGSGAGRKSSTRSFGDKDDNCITVCNMENFDPLGIHTGESIVIAPSQTLTDREYHLLRSVALKVIRSIGIVGECNIQYALDPKSEEYRIIEVNARLSRSSALASKATGYPLAYVAAKLALGASLTEISNKITKATMSCFEPALNYCVVKIPRWDLGKFKEVDTHLGSEMKSVGEVMSIGRSFEEALQKAIRMTGTGAQGLSDDPKLMGREFTSIKKALNQPTDRRLFAIYRALTEGWTVEAIHKQTKIDRWFLERIAAVHRMEEELRAHGASGVGSANKNGSANKIGAVSFPPEETILAAKKLGFSDEGLAAILGLKESDIRNFRESRGILPVVKQIDTLAAEYPAETNYLYMTYLGERSDITPSGTGIMVPGSGPYRIGSSVEFDWCCVNAIQTSRNLGRRTIMVNCNPETVSTDYDACDRLYFEELSLERVLDIYEFERPEGMILSMGGQIPEQSRGQALRRRRRDTRHLSIEYRQGRGQEQILRPPSTLWASTSPNGRI